jgi:hypothetical protein
VIAALLPSGCVSTHTLFCLKRRLPLRDQRVLCLLLNSYVLIFLVRQRVSTHVTLAVMHTMPVPRPSSESADYRDMCGLAELLSHERAGREKVLARAQALAAWAYALEPDEYRHVLSTFPLVPVEERHAAFEEFTRLRLRESR